MTVQWVEYIYIIGILVNLSQNNFLELQQPRWGSGFAGSDRTTVFPSLNPGLAKSPTPSLIPLWPLELINNQIYWRSQPHLADTVEYLRHEAGEGTLHIGGIQRRGLEKTFTNLE